MEEIVKITAQLVRGIRLAYTRKAHFLVLFVLIFIGSTMTLGRLDLLPNALSATATKTLTNVSKDLDRSSPSALATTDTSAFTKVEEPVQIMIPSIALSATIANPTSTSVAVLDELLLKGAVRYPTSAKLGEQGNVVLFGHSSYLPVVGNQAYKTFNNIQKLKQGDTITVYSSGTVYTYAVRTMTKESAKDAAIPLLVAGRVLTLATCDTFGAKSDRFVVTADFVESHVLGA